MAKRRTRMSRSTTLCGGAPGKLFLLGKTVIAIAVASSDESDEEDEVYQICNRVNTPCCGNKIQWEGCNNCDLWYHEQCLN